MEAGRDNALKRQRNFVGCGFSLKPSKSGMKHENTGAKAKELKIQDLLGLQSDFKVSLGNLTRLYLKIKSIKRARK